MKKQLLTFTLPDGTTIQFYSKDARYVVASQLINNDGTFGNWGWNYYTSLRDASYFKHIYETGGPFARKSNFEVVLIDL